MLNSARQIIRWAVPGWLGYILIRIFIIFSDAVNGKINIEYFNNFFFELGAALIPLALVAIPLGYVIYQLYYWVYWQAPIPYRLRFVIDPHDRARIILEDMNSFISKWESMIGRKFIDSRPTPFEVKEFRFGLKLNLKNPAIMNSYRENWTFLESVWYIALNDDKLKNVKEYLERRAQFLSDIYHSLGACVTSLYLSFAFYIAVYELPTIGDEGYCIQKSIISILVNIAVFTFLHRVFMHGRGASFHSVNRHRRDVIYYCWKNQIEIEKNQIRRVV